MATFNVFTSLSAATATGAGIASNWDQGRPTRDYSVQVTTTGTPASFSISLEGSIDGVIWVAVGAAITTVGISAFNPTTSPLVRYLRANLTALGSGTSPTVTAVVVAKDF